MKRVLVYAPCADFLREAPFRLRILPLVEPLRARGIELDLRVRTGMPMKRLLLARSARRYDHVILHRKWLDGYEARALRRSLPRGGRIFMDIDDATMHHETELGAITRRRLDRRVAATCKIIDVACPGNDYLAAYFRERGIESRVIPTVVEPAKYAVKEHRDTASPRLVWLGSNSTLKHLEAAMPTLAAARARVPGLSLVAICDAPPSAAGADGLPVEHVRWSLEGEAAALLRGDIGLSPMAESRWTLGKCGFKIVQYMAAGLPVVASPVGVNATLLQASAGAPAAGLPATTPEEWVAAIELLAKDAALRASLGANGRARVEAELSVSKIVDAWAGMLA